MRPASGVAVIGFFAPAASFQETHLQLLRVSVGHIASRIWRPCNMSAVDSADDVEPAVLASSSLRLRAHLLASLPATVPSGHPISICDVPNTWHSHQVHLRWQSDSTPDPGTGGWPRLGA